MNDETPRKYRGTLLERAAARYDLSPRAWSQPEGYAAHAPAREPRRSISIDRAVLASGGLLVPGAPVGALAEEFRLAKRQLLATARSLEANGASGARMVLMCSAKPGDGKTYCAVNLALSLAAERDVEILLVDADVAKPDVLCTLGQDIAGPGLLDVLGDPALDVEDCIVGTDIPHLSILPLGTKTHGDTELIASDRARVVLARLAAADPRRMVIFDAPPALAASAAPALANHVGQVVLVVRADRTSESDLRATVALFDGCDHVSLLLNAVAFQPGGRRYDGYYDHEAAE